MGISGLLQNLRSITHPATFDRYKGLTVAVDAMSWLHKGIFSCDVRALARQQWEEHENQAQTTGEENIEKQNIDIPSRIQQEKKAKENETIKKIDFDQFVEKDDISHKNNKMKCSESSECSYEISHILSKKYISYTTRCAQILEREYKMKVILVIDGSPIQTKAKIDKKRREDRQNAFRDATFAELKGNKTPRVVRQLYAKSCSITHEMRYELIVACRELGISFIVAPYEADAQMAFMAQNGAVDLVISEDSDLLAYGCPRILFKIDFKERKGEEIQLMRNLAQNDELSFRNWTHDMFVYMCILSGCDYNEGVKGVGIKGAHKIVRMNRAPVKIFLAIKKMGKIINTNFEEDFWKAFKTFRYQRVYSAEKKAVQMLMEPMDHWGNNGEDIDTNWNFLGPYITPETAVGIANGIIHPVQKIPWKSIMLLEKKIPNFKDSGQIVPSKNDPITNDTKDFLDEEDKHRKLFSFFSKDDKKKIKSNGPTNNLEPNRYREPLKEVSLLENGNAFNRMQGRFKSKKRKKMKPNPQPRDCEYSSQLVGSGFQTISRQNLHKQKRCIRSNLAKIMHQMYEQNKVYHTKQTTKKDNPPVQEYNQVLVENQAKILSQIAQNECKIQPSNQFDPNPSINYDDFLRNMPHNKYDRLSRITNSSTDLIQKTSEGTPTIIEQSKLNQIENNMIKDRFNHDSTIMNKNYENQYLNIYPLRHDNNINKRETPLNLMFQSSIQNREEVDSLFMSTFENKNIDQHLQQIDSDYVENNHSLADEKNANKEDTTMHDNSINSKKCFANEVNFETFQKIPELSQGEKYRGSPSFIGNSSLSLRNDPSEGSQYKPNWESKDQKCNRAEIVNINCSDFFACHENYYSQECVIPQRVLLHEKSSRCTDDWNSRSDFDQMNKSKETYFSSEIKNKSCNHEKFSSNEKNYNQDLTLSESVMMQDEVLRCADNFQRDYEKINSKVEEQLNNKINNGKDDLEYIFFKESHHQNLTSSHMLLLQDEFTTRCTDKLHANSFTDDLNEKNVTHANSENNDDAAYLSMKSIEMQHQNNDIRLWTNISYL